MSTHLSAAEFQRLPWLVDRGRVAALTGHGKLFLNKLVDCGTLEHVRPRGTARGKFLKRQLAQWLGVSVEGQLREFGREPMLLSLKAVARHTGWSEHTLQHIVRAGGLPLVVLPGGARAPRVRKRDLARLLQLEDTL